MTRLLASALALFILSATAHAETADREKPMNIEADSADFDQKQMAGIYRGSVIVTQGTMELRAAELTAREQKDGSQFVAGRGKPVRFKQRLDTGEWVNAEALRFEYNDGTGELRLMDDAWVKRDTGDEVRGPVITYNMKTELYQAVGGEKGRVNIVIQPKKKAASPATDAPKKDGTQ
ncbi:lipopolysaccharide transport periplasmic protein LptA [Chitinibacteraceae bacterium HSL-7]